MIPILILCMIFWQGCNNQHSSSVKDESAVKSYINDNTKKEEPVKNALVNIAF